MALYRFAFLIALVAFPGESHPAVELADPPEDVPTVINELRRYAAVILDPTTPAVGLEVIVNDARAVPYFERLMKELGIPGQVVVSP